MDTPTTTRWIVLAVCCALVAVPPLLVTIPPSTDLPQHIAQVRLLLDVMATPDPAYVVHPFTPYNLGYVLIGIGYGMFGPLGAARFTIAALGVSWTVACHVLAARRGSPASAATLASVFVFNHALYWGFINFLIGWPIFVVWLLLMLEPWPDRLCWRHGAKVLLVAVLLYTAHAFWLAAAFGCLGLLAAIERPGWAAVAHRSVWAAPVAVAAAVWFASFSQSWYGERLIWYRSGLLDKLSVDWIVTASLGGLWGPLESMIVAVAAVWIVGTILSARRRLAAAVDWRLAAIAALFAAVAFLAPYQYQHTIFFSERWMPPAVVLLLLALPAVPAAERALRLGAVLLLGVFVGLTTQVWTSFERDELSGLVDSVRAVPAGARVLGLDMIQESAYIRWRPFMNAPAYADAISGARTAYSFAEFPQSLVTFRDRDGSRSETWRAISWNSNQVTREHVVQFDSLLVNGSEGVHTEIETRLGGEFVAGSGRWRLFRVVPAAVETERAADDHGPSGAGTVSAR